MAESFLIALREGFEASLIVAIVLAFVNRRAPHHARAVWLGTIGAVVVAGAVGVILHLTIDGLEGVAEQRTFAVVCFAAAGLLTWMIFWMRTHARALKGHLESKAGEALITGSALGLVLVAFTAVIREGLETALFLLSATSTAHAGDVVVGTVAGLAVATGLGVLVYHGSSRFDMRRFFQVTGALIILFAAGLVAKGIFFLQASGDLSTFDNAFYDVTGARWLTIDTQSGRFLAGIFGWDPRPSVEQVVGYLGYLLPIGYLYFRTPPAVSEAALAPSEPEAASVGV